MTGFKIGNRHISKSSPAYFIADVAANHDGDLVKAKELIHMVADSGGHAAKFQNFQAKKIISSKGFEDLKGQLAHQAKWKKSVAEVYEDASISGDWTPELKNECKKAGIDYFTSPYDHDSVDMVDPYVDIYKVGSGDITWLDIIEYIAQKGKPIMLASGASTLDEVKLAMGIVHKYTHNAVLMQCNTNYTGSRENFKNINLNVLKQYTKTFPETVLGLSDHTPGHTTVLGAIALGATVIEKHFTDDNKKDGPDHGFSMNPATWTEMVEAAKDLQNAMGDGVKVVEENEKNSIIVQRRSIRAKHALEAGRVIQANDLEYLRPIPSDGIPPYSKDGVIGQTLTSSVAVGAHLTWEALQSD